MAAIAKISLQAAAPASECWAAVAQAVQDWAVASSISLRDALVLVPYAQLLPVARQAFARCGGWQPRIETSKTLARSLGPPAPSHPLQLCFDDALDRLTAARLVQGQAWAQAQAADDPAAFDHAVAGLVQTAQALAHAAAAVAPSQRDAHWAQGRILLGTAAGPGMRERLLARIACEWAAAAPTPASDALFELQPSAWIVVQAGGADALCRAVQEHASASTPCLLIDTDAVGADPFAAVAALGAAEVAVCEDFEAEAQRCAAQVLDDLAGLSEGAAPVALIAQDRVLVRRVRALLARRGVPLIDETGWRLSTTRAGALVASLLRCAAPHAGSDDWIDWLKHGNTGASMRSLESTVRRQGWTRAERVDATALPEVAAALWSAARRVVDDLGVMRPRLLADWLGALRTALQGSGAWSPLAADDAGRQLVTALHLDSAPAVAPGEPMAFAAFSRWVDAALESTSFLPAPDRGGPLAPCVVITPLERAVLRPFASVVLAAADEKHLGATSAPHPLLGDAMALALGLPDAQARRTTETLAFLQLLRCPHVTFLRRVDDGGEPLAASPLLERLNLARLRAGRSGLAAAADARPERRVPVQPVLHPRPVAPALLPARLSASACEALRACPYRFFALHLLRLRPAEELDDTVEKRDYGTWLHAVLERFHRQRGEPPTPAHDVERLQAIALEVRQEMGLDDGAFLPYAASFARLVPPYLEWLQARDGSGARWLDSEVQLTARPAEWQGIEMYGVIDRVDSVQSDDASIGPVTQLIDYKTGNRQALQQLVGQPQEDTQLAFYAALMARQSDAAGPIAACYLPLDAGDLVETIEHRDVEFSAAQLVEGLGNDLARLRGGAALPALGVGRACEHCDARGLCRRDHWAVGAAPA